MMMVVAEVLQGVLGIPDFMGETDFMFCCFLSSQCNLLLSFSFYICLLYLLVIDVTWTGVGYDYLFKCWIHLIHVSKNIRKRQNIHITLRV